MEENTNGICRGCGGTGKKWMQEHQEYWICGACNGSGDLSNYTYAIPTVNTSSEMGIPGTMPSGEFYETVMKAAERNEWLMNEYENPKTVIGKIKKFLLS